MAPASPAGSAPGSPRLPPSRSPGAGARRPPATGRTVVDRAFPRTPRGALKISRTLVALAAFICFAVSGAHGAYTALAGMETVITLLFLLLYLFRVDARMRFLLWPLAVLGLILLVLCIVDAVLLCKKIRLERGRGRSAPPK
ncbi:chemokine-like factor isoform X2 [Zonotrichia leucophrys gambelii]|uniref:chemokine-like factor isoform X2 n=1 Tax=Zonotrichia leucophrys gambelii TaxID=257770 RepID=UPI0006B7F97E